MTKDQEVLLEERIKEEMSKIRDSSLLLGCKTICGVVLKKAKDGNKTEHERLEDIISFCERSLDIKSKL